MVSGAVAPGLSRLVFPKRLIRSRGGRAQARFFLDRSVFGPASMDWAWAWAGGAMGSRTGYRAKPVGRVVCAAPRSTKAVLKQRRDNAASARKAVDEGANLRGVSQNARFGAVALRHFQVSDGVAEWFANRAARGFCPLRRRQTPVQFAVGDCF